MVAPALDLSESFAAGWRALGAPKRLLLAVSGGSDSIALLHLSASLRARGALLRVATVDHGLRGSSADDARFVERQAGALGVDAVTLRWDGIKPLTGVQAAARAARYRLLAREAESWKAEAIVTAHTADDQAETVLMRIARRSGVRGLSGMAAEILIADGANGPQRLLRPLLAHRRAELRSFLLGVGGAFVDDPGNADPRFERVRARRALAASPQGQEATRALLTLANDARRLTALIGRHDDARLADVGAEFRVDGAVALDAEAVDPAIDGALLARLLAAAGGGEAPADGDAASALAAALAGRPRTLAGALVRLSGAKIEIVREPSAIFGRSGGAAAPALSLAPGARLLWDRRFSVENLLGAPAQVRPIGSAAHALTLTASGALETAPGLFIGATLGAFPGDDGVGELAIRSLVRERFQRLVVRH